MARCRLVFAKEVGWYWLPECMGGAVRGKQGCTCPSDRLDAIEARLADLERSRAYREG